MSTDDNLINTQSHMVRKKRGGKRVGAGRKVGSKSGTTLLSAAIRDDFTRLARKRSRKVFETLANKAEAGESWAVKLFLDKLLPNAQTEHTIQKGDFGIQIIIGDMKEETVIEGEVIDADPEL